MRKVATTYSVNNEYVDFTPGTRNGTLYGQRWLNNVQTDLIKIQEAAGLSEGDGADARVLAGAVKVFQDRKRPVGVTYESVVYREATGFDYTDLDAYFNGICLDAVDGSEDISDANWPDLVPVLRSVKMRSGARTVFNCVIVGQDIFLSNATEETNLLETLAEWQVDFGSYTNWISVTVEGSEFAITGIFPATRRISVDGFPEQGTGACEIYPHRVAGDSGSARVFKRIRENEYVVVTPGGVTWTGRTSPLSATLQQSLYGNGVYLVAGSTECATSTDGITWTSRSTGVSVLCGAYGNGLFVLSGGSSAAVAYSSDGATWNTSSIPVMTQCEGMAFGDGVFVAVGNGRVARSTDGINWTDIAYLGVFLYHVHYGNGLFVASGGSTSGGSPSPIYTSPDGITWTSRSSSLVNDMRAGAYGAGLHILAGQGGQLATSPDGITWTTRTSGQSSRIFGATFADDVIDGPFVIVTADQTNPGISTSPDGITWTTRTPAYTGSLDAINSVSYGNGLYVAAGEAGQIQTSPYGLLSGNSILPTPFYYKYLHGGRYVP